MQQELFPRSQRAFELSIGKTSGYLNVLQKRNSIPSAEVVATIILKYPKYSAHWILTGEGSKYVNADQKSIVNEEKAIYEIEKDKFKILKTFFSEEYNALNNKLDLIHKENTEILNLLNKEYRKK